MYGIYRDDQRIIAIWSIVLEAGTFIQRAQSDWGVDIYRWKGVDVALGGAGYTYYVSWGDRLNCHYTINSVCDRPVFTKGGPEDLHALFEGIKVDFAQFRGIMPK